MSAEFAIPGLMPQGSPKHEAVRPIADGENTAYYHLLDLPTTEAVPLFLIRLTSILGDVLYEQIISVLDGAVPLRDAENAPFTGVDSIGAAIAIAADSDAVVDEEGAAIIRALLEEVGFSVSQNTRVVTMGPEDSSDRISWVRSSVAETTRSFTLKFTPNAGVLGVSWRALDADRRVIGHGQTTLSHGG